MRDFSEKFLPIWRTSDGWGLYIHVPFCARKCPYCDFTIAVNARPPEDEYVDALEREIRARQSEMHGPLRTIYVGGGTPSMLSTAAVARLGEALVQVLPSGSLDEFTVEFNPEHASVEKLAAWRAIGATRVSLGVQALSQEALTFLGRAHDEAGVRVAVDNAVRAGFSHVSIDFIFALPGVTPQSTLRDVELGLTIPGVDHISLYELTIESQTPFGAQVRRGAMTPRSDDEVIQLWRTLVSTIEAAGFARYEVSNYAKPGGRAQHNASYWTGRPYLGVGVGSSSLSMDRTRGIVVRRTNARALKGYLQDPLVGAQIEELSAAEHLAERLTLALRTREGLDLPGIEADFGLALPAVERAVEAMVSRGLLTSTPQHARRYAVTDRGMEIADSLALSALDGLDLDLDACQSWDGVYSTKGSP